MLRLKFFFTPRELGLQIGALCCRANDYHDFSNCVLFYLSSQAHASPARSINCIPTTGRKESVFFGQEYIVFQVKTDYAAAGCTIQTIFFSIINII